MCKERDTGSLSFFFLFVLSTSYNACETVDLALSREFKRRHSQIKGSGNNTSKTAVLIVFAVFPGFSSFRTCDLDPFVSKITRGDADIYVKTEYSRVKDSTMFGMI